MTDYANAESMLLKSILSDRMEVANRNTLGPLVPIQLFQALRLIGMGSSIEQMVGDGARALVYQSGQRVGHVLGQAVVGLAGKDVDRYLALVREVCLKLSIGQVVLEKMDNTKGLIVLRVDECVSCAGLGGATAPICHFEAGLVGGLVKVFVGRDVRAVETRCNAVGDKTCGIEVKVLG
ncbi:MAG: V4R domain-containing protein [Myxococcales bacterium]